MKIILAIMAIGLCAIGAQLIRLVRAIRQWGRVCMIGHSQDKAHIPMESDGHTLVTIFCNGELITRFGLPPTMTGVEFNVSSTREISI